MKNNWCGSVEKIKCCAICGVKPIVKVHTKIKHFIPSLEIKFQCPTKTERCKLNANSGRKSNALNHNVVDFLELILNVINTWNSCQDEGL